jgi:uncharacterized integral membrane protein
MRARTAFLLLILGGLGIFAALNWSVFTAPTSLSLVFARVEAPLGVIMLTVTAAVTLLYAMLVAWRETSALLESRRYARELEAQRHLAESAEASRYTQLRAFLESELAVLRTGPETTSREAMQRLDRLETTLRAEIDRASNTLAAYIGEVEERLSRSDRTVASSS